MSGRKHKQLKAGFNVKYGLPYQGSKSKVIERISKHLPGAENFYDLFGGGFSVSHYMLLNRRRDFKAFHYNDIRPGLCELIKDCIDGKYNYDNFKPEWISRERFMAEKESNAYIKIIWSFGNNGKDYLFGKDIENQKRSMHQAVVFDEFDDYMRDVFNLDKWPGHLTITGKRLYLKRFCHNQRLERLQQLQQLQQLERLQQLQQLELTNLDYRSVVIKPNSVVYCDIPYKGTSDYGNSFSHDGFFNWADAQPNPVYISEYNIDDDRFKLVKSFNHRSTFSVSANNAVTERLYCNRAAIERINNG